MRNLLVVWLLLCSVALGAQSETFAPADRVGEGNERSFFVLSTSAGGYVIRHDGMGEFTSPAGLRRVFMLKVGVKGRIDRVYFLEHQRDLFLMYEVHDASSQWSYLVRMEQTKRKARWVTEVDSVGLGAPVIQGEFVVIKDVQISEANGALRKN